MISLKLCRSIALGFALLALLPGCFCVSWKNYEGAPATRIGADGKFWTTVGSTHSGFSAFIQNSGPPYSLETEFSRTRPFESYSVDQAELVWPDGHWEVLATPARLHRAVAAKSRSGYVARIELPQTFRHVPAEGTEVTLRMKVTVVDSSGRHAHRIGGTFRYSHVKGCHAITAEALSGA